MVLPGIQALFGFQLVAVFNQNFKAALSYPEQLIHLCAILMVTASVILVTAPAAYHRQNHHRISMHFLKISSNFLAAGMIPLMLGTCADLYLIARIITASYLSSALVAGLALCVFTGIWIVYPNMTKSTDQEPVL